MQLTFAHQQESQMLHQMAQWTLVSPLHCPEAKLTNLMPNLAISVQFPQHSTVQEQLKGQVTGNSCFLHYQYSCKMRSKPLCTGITQASHSVPLSPRIILNFGNVWLVFCLSFLSGRHFDKYIIC